MALLPQAIADLVATDGLPRQVVADDGSRHVLYIENAIVRSMEAAAWLAQRGALPTDPTQTEIDAAILARQQASQQAQAGAAQLRQQVLDLARNAVGVRVDLLTAAQVRTLFAIVLWQEGALAADLTVRPLADWVVH